MGKKAIVVGASSGIGKAITLGLLKKGYTVGITGRRSELLQAIEKSNPGYIHSSSFDCTDSNATNHLDMLIEQLGGLDLFILSAGTGELNPDLVPHLEADTNTLNVTAFTKLVLWAYKKFETQGSGHLVGITSIAGMRGSAIAPSYNASKAYQINYLEGLRQKAQKQKHRISVTDVRPGFVDTNMAKGDGKFWVAQPDKAAAQILNAVMAKKDKVYITKRWRIIGIILKILPTWLYKKL